jgi:hypothetical protein
MRWRRVEGETRPAYASPRLFHNHQTERNKTMKLTKNQIKEKQEELVETILKLDALGKQKKSLVAILDDDFNENEAKYRSGVVTPKGILVRKPRWDFSAKGVAEVA